MAKEEKMAKKEKMAKEEKMAKKSKDSMGTPVLVCTEKRGVFFGYAQRPESDPLILERPRMCVYWSQDVKGVLGLAATGPTAGCRVTAAPPRIELRGITAVATCSVGAMKAWEAAPWK